jgi:hypothetical protein
MPKTNSHWGKPLPARYMKVQDAMRSTTLASPYLESSIEHAQRAGIIVCAMRRSIAAQ